MAVYINSWIKTVPLFRGRCRTVAEKHTWWICSWESSADEWGSRSRSFLWPAVQTTFSTMVLCRTHHSVSRLASRSQDGHASGPLWICELGKLSSCRLLMFILFYFLQQKLCLIMNFGALQNCWQSDLNAQRLHGRMGRFLYRDGLTHSSHTPTETHTTPFVVCSSHRKVLNPLAGELKVFFGTAPSLFLFLFSLFILLWYLSVSHITLILKI